MPSEFRFLVYSSSEAATALAAYARAHDRELPEGRIAGAEPVGEKRINGRLLVETGLGPPTIVHFKTEEILEALIEDCLSRRIPLPRVSEKALERLQGRFALRIGHVDSIELMMRGEAVGRG